MELKEYQKNALLVLRAFLEDARLRGPADAFRNAVKKYPADSRPQRYNARWNLDDAPYVCLRLPTGGGKTLLAAHAVGVAHEAYLETEWPFVIWLVPTNAIRKQTAQALRDPAHPCRQALGASFGEHNVAVFDIDEINDIRPQDAFGKACIVVATMQTLRVDDKNKLKRKVYGHNENFERHFAKLANVMPGLDKTADGSPVYSFVNMAHQLRPLVIADEAHKMISRLSGEVMRRINPACVIEFTATPVESNVLFRAWPSELKAEEMVKLPFNLQEHPEWESAVRGALATRASLEEIARSDPRRIRPIILFQAENADRPCNAQRLREFLLAEGVKENEIAVATGDQRELDSVNLFDGDCPVKHVITVEALKEGWDCSFAYVFCSVANIKSAVDIEQFLGRVMRMPYAQARQQEKLNMAYANVVASGFGEAAAEINSHLCEMGFDEEEALENIRQAPLPGPPEDVWGDLPLFENEGKSRPGELTIEVERAPDFSALDEEERENIKVEEKDGRIVVSASCMLTREAEHCILAATPEAERFQARRKMADHRLRTRKGMPPTAAEKGVAFPVPLLLWEQDEQFEPADAACLLPSDWSLLDSMPKDRPLFNRSDFDYDPKIKAFQFDLDGERMTFHPLGEMEQGLLYSMPESYDEFSLARWLDRACRQEDVSQAEMLEFCRRATQALLESGHSLERLFQGKKLIARLIVQKIAALRQAAKRTAFQNLLAGKKAVKMAFENDFVFPASHYAENVSPYQGNYQFKKHYLGVPRDLGRKGEEFRCAQALDMHPQVVTWLRNVDRRQGSFFLPTSTDNFYPDFAAKLADGRTLLMEYKGEHLLDGADAREKLNIGRFWEERSEGKGCFAMVCETREEYKFERQMKRIFNLGLPPQTPPGISQPPDPPF